MFMDECLLFQIGDNSDMESQNSINVPPFSSAAAQINIDSLGKIVSEPQTENCSRKFLKILFKLQEYF